MRRSVRCSGSVVITRGGDGSTLGPPGVHHAQEVLQDVTRWMPLLMLSVSLGLGLAACER